ALGADKIDSDAAWYRAMKRMWDTHRAKAFVRRIVGLPPNPRYSPQWYPRSFCAIYRLDLIRRLGLTWQPSGRPTGELLYRGLVDGGYDAVQLSSDEMRYYVEHVGHATALVARGGLRHWRGNQKVQRALGRVMGSELAKELLSDDSLDR
ncbi:MAG: hypothetical protein NT049_17850, partial [Planctomycetota bacterium]|nr:hypothetical protein [Planctomycetota bacterium]